MAEEHAVFGGEYVFPLEIHEGNALDFEPPRSIRERGIQFERVNAHSFHRPTWTMPPSLLSGEVAQPLTVTATLGGVDFVSPAGSAVPRMTPQRQATTNARISHPHSPILRIRIDTL